MKKQYPILLLMMLIVFNSCNPKISTSISKKFPPLDYKQEVLVIGIDQQEPDSTEVIGVLKIGDSGFSTNCGYEKVIEEAKLEARKAGGNAIKITEHKTPSAMGSSCHRIKAKILNVKDPQKLLPLEEDEKLNVDYAILNIYRYGGAGSLIGYDLYLEDTVLCRVKNNYKTTIHIKKEGSYVLWAKTEAKIEVPINLKFGKEYYLKCGITMGAFVGHPKIELVEKKIGKQEFESFNAKNR